jgi:hypothetical protein
MHKAQGETNYQVAPQSLYFSGNNDSLGRVSQSASAYSSNNGLHHYQRLNYPTSSDKDYRNHAHLSDQMGEI